MCTGTGIEGFISAHHPTIFYSGIHLSGLSALKPLVPVILLDMLVFMLAEVLMFLLVEVLAKTLDEWLVFLLAVVLLYPVSFSIDSIRISETLA